MADDLVIPTLVGPVSTLSTVLRVQGHLPNAKVKVVGSLGRTVADDFPTAPGDGLVPLVVKGLEPGELLRAQQFLGLTQKSEQSPDHARLQVLGPPLPQDAGPLTLVTHPYDCGGCVYVEGAYPGADARLFGASFGHAEALGTFARFGITPPMRGSMSGLATAQQVGPYAGAAAPVEAPTEYPTVDKRRRVPPPPRILSPVGECAGGVDVDGIIDGATVELEQVHIAGGKPTFHRTCVDVDAAFWPLANLRDGDVLRVRQTLCGVTSAPSQDVRVGPLVVGTPWAYPPCAGSHVVIVGGLQPTSEVTLRVFRKGILTTTFRGAAYAGLCKFTVPDDTFAEADELDVQQTLCTVSSPFGPKVRVRAGKPLEKPVLLHPVYQCASRVRVDGVPLGAEVGIFSKAHDMTIGTATCLDPGSAVVDVPVPSLGVPDTLWPWVRDCGQGVLGDGVDVQSVGDVRPPTIEPVVACAPIVVKDIVPGAVVELYVQQTPTSPMLFVPPTVVCTTTQYAFPVPSALRVGSAVRARQRVCTQVSAMSAQQIAVAGALSVGAYRRVSQLTGATDDDPNSSLPHPNNTETDQGLGLPGMDLGVPLEHQGRLYLLFGDSSQKRRTAAPSFTIVKPIAEVVDAPENPEDGLTLRFLTEATNPTQVARLEILDVSSMSETLDEKTVSLQQLGDPYDVPTGAFSYDGQVHVFVMRSVQHTAIANEYSAVFGPGNQVVLKGVAPHPIGGRSVLASGSTLSQPLVARTVTDIRTFGTSAVTVAPTQWKFINIAAQVVDLSTVPELGASGDGLLLWGSGRFRASDVCFAWVPLQPGKPIPGPSEWRFLTGFAGTSPTFTVGRMDLAIGILQWSDTGVLAAQTTAFDKPENLPFTVGEFSVTYLAQMRSWLMLFGHDVPQDYFHLLGRIASRPWGPWLPGTTASGQRGAIVVDASGEPEAVRVRSGIYAPHVLSRYTRWDEKAGALRLYVLGSFLTNEKDPNPSHRDDHGQVHLFSTEIRCVPV